MLQILNLLILRYCLRSDEMSYEICSFELLFHRKDLFKIINESNFFYTSNLNKAIT